MKARSALPRSVIAMSLRNRPTGSSAPPPEGESITPPDRVDEVVVVIAGTSWDGIWYPERHVAVHLAKRIPVLWVDPPVSLLSPRYRRPSARHLVREARMRRVERNIWR